MDLKDSYKPEVIRLVRKEWGSDKIVSRGIVHDASSIPGLAATNDDKLKGFLLYDLKGSECEIVALKSVVENQGIGTQLIEEIKEKASALGCTRLWVITTNNNTHALEFYKKRGFSIFKIHENAIEESRKLKPSIPLVDENNVPIKDEIELEMSLS